MTSSGSSWAMFFAWIRYYHFHSPFPHPVRSSNGLSHHRGQPRGLGELAGAVSKTFTTDRNCNDFVYVNPYYYDEVCPHCLPLHVACLSTPPVREHIAVSDIFCGYPAWQRWMESNHQSRSQSPLPCRLATPLCAGGRVSNRISLSGVLL